MYCKTIKDILATLKHLAFDSILADCHHSFQSQMSYVNLIGEIYKQCLANPPPPPLPHNTFEKKTTFKALTEILLWKLSVSLSNGIYSISV